MELFSSTFFCSHFSLLIQYKHRRWYSVIGISIKQKHDLKVLSRCFSYVHDMYMDPKCESVISKIRFWVMRNFVRIVFRNVHFYVCIEKIKKKNDKFSNGFSSFFNILLDSEPEFHSLPEANDAWFSHFIPFYYYHLPLLSIRSLNANDFNNNIFIIHNSYNFKSNRVIEIKSYFFLHTIGPAYKVPISFYCFMNTEHAEHKTINHKKNLKRSLMITLIRKLILTYNDWYIHKVQCNLFDNYY